jgi:hypothetical protein
MILPTADQTAQEIKLSSPMLDCHYAILNDIALLYISRVDISAQLVLLEVFFKFFAIE